MDNALYFSINKEAWNKRAVVNKASAFYNVDSFRAGNSSLNALEREALGDVSGKSLLHLQCHFGLDTLSWAKEGARVTGIDFSDQAIATAQQLSDESHIGAEFI